MESEKRRSESHKVKPTTKPLPGWLTSAQAAELLGITPGTLKNWRYEGRDPESTRVGKIGSRIYYSPSDLNDYLASEQRRSEADKARPTRLTTVQAAKLLGIAPGTLRNWRLQGRGPESIRVGKARSRVYYSPRVLEDYLHGRAAAAGVPGEGGPDLARSTPVDMTRSDEEKVARHPANREDVEAHKQRMPTDMRAYRLREFRKAAGLTQAQLAERMGVGPRQVSTIERNDIDSAKVGTIRRYLEAIGGGLAMGYVVGDQRLSLTEHVGTVAESPSLSGVAKHSGDVLVGISALVKDVVADLAPNGEPVPEPLCVSGGVVVPVDQLEMLLSIAEDAAIAPMVAERIAAGGGRPFDELLNELGMSELASSRPRDSEQ